MKITEKRWCVVAKNGFDPHEVSWIIWGRGTYRTRKDVIRRWNGFWIDEDMSWHKARRRGIVRAVPCTVTVELEK